MITSVQVRIDRLSVQFATRVVQYFQNVLGGALDNALRVDLEQGPADVGDVMLDRFEVGRLFRRVTVNRGFRQWRFG